MMRLFLFYSLLSILVVSCSNRDKDNIDPGNLYFDYKINAREGDENLTVHLQYREDDEEGYGMVIPGSNAVTIDEQDIPRDSSKIKGFYYEIAAPIRDFIGEHTITVLADNKQFKETFLFETFSLLTALPDTMARNEYILSFKGVEEGDIIRMLITDTSFINNGIHRIDTIHDGKLIIKAEDLQELSGGPVQLELIKEAERPLKNAGSKGGRLVITYGLRREFILRN